MVGGGTCADANKADGAAGESVAGEPAAGEPVAGEPSEGRNVNKCENNESPFIYVGTSQVERQTYTSFMVEPQRQESLLNTGWKKYQQQRRSETWLASERLVGCSFMFEDRNAVSDVFKA